MIIFHIAKANEWEKSRKAGTFRPASLNDAGYLHASMPHQVLPVANSVFRGKKGLLLLEIDTEKLKSEVKNEDLRKSGSPYPHIYGPINWPSVVKAHPFEPKSDGTFELPASIVVTP